MKKVWLLLLSLLLLLVLSGCSESSFEPYTVEKGWRTFEVNPETSTVSDGTHTYEYTFSGDSSDYRITITYPDGSTYSVSKSGSSIIGTASKDYDRNRYIDGDTLCDVIAEGAPEPSKPRNPFAGVLVILFGLFPLFAPRMAWYLEWGWRFKDAEPSNLALICNRISGAVCIIFGILLVFLI